MGDIIYLIVIILLVISNIISLFRGYKLYKKNIELSLLCKEVQDFLKNNGRDKHRRTNQNDTETSDEGTK